MMAGRDSWWDKNGPVTLASREVVMWQIVWGFMVNAPFGCGFLLKVFRGSVKYLR